MTDQQIYLSIAIICAGLLAFIFKKLDLKGSLTGIIMAFSIWLGSGEIALLALLLFFVLGTLASMWKKEAKAKLKVAQENDGKRSIQNVLANGGIATFLSILAFIIPTHQEKVMIMVISCFAVACSDTLSSELGNVYGKKYVDILSLRPANRGIDGAVSIQGFLFGAIGSLVIGLLPLLFNLPWQKVILVSITGFLGNLIDSILGASLQQQGKLSNHQVNFWATLSGAFLSLILLLIFKT